MTTCSHLRPGLGIAASALILCAATSAVAQTTTYPPGSDCQRLGPQQAAVCESQQGTSQLPPTPAGNGTGTNQNGTLGGSGESNGSSLGAGGGNGGASAPGQPIQGQPQPQQQ